MISIRLLQATVAALAVAPALAQVFPEAVPASRPDAGIYSPRLLSLGEPRFSDPGLYNLFDQGGSPMGLMETRKERLGLTFGYLGTDRATPGDSLALGHSGLTLPHLGFQQPGVFVASLYYLRESGAYRRTAGDSVESRGNLIGLDMAAGPASGLFRVGFGAHARLGGLEYSGAAERILVAVPSLRFDLGSRPHPAVEVGLFAGFGGRFDSLKSPAGHLERTAAVTLPRYGALADLGGTEELPLMANVVVELGTERMFGEYRVFGDSGIQYPTIWNNYWTFQAQALYPFQAGEFRLQPALRFARRSEKAQGYEGIESNQDPFKKGPEIPGLSLTRAITAFGLGGQVGFRDMVSLLLEWETAGHAYEADSAREQRYNRFSLGLEHHVHRLPVDFPEAVSLTLRAGWAWRQDAETRPEYRAYQFDPFLPSPLPTVRPAAFNPRPDDPAGYSAFSLGFGLGLFEDRLGMDGFLGFPGQPERTGIGSQDASGTEFGITVSYRVL